MADHYQHAAADDTARNLSTPTVPNAAGLVYNQTTGQLEMRPPSASDWQPIPGALTSVQTLRTRVTTAQANAGITLLAAKAGFKYRLVDFTLIAIGGNAATATSVRLRATQAASVVSLAVALIAALTRSTLVKPNTANVTVLADGASFVANDANTAITLDVDNNNLATATDIDVILQYVLEAA
jgi:hypothetical protein